VTARISCRQDEVAFAVFYVLIHFLIDSYSSRDLNENHFSNSGGSSGVQYAPRGSW